MGNLAKNRTIVVTGGAGFLGQFVVSELKKRGYKKIFVPRSRQFDLRKEAAVKRLYQLTKPSAVIHLAAVVGGIGINQKEPGRFFYDNAMMGICLIEQARQYRVKKFVTVGTICAYPKFCPVPFKEENLWNGYPEETNAPYGLAKKMLLVQSQAYRNQYDFNAIFLLPVNLYGPGDNFDLNTSHVIPALIRKFLEAIKLGKKEVVLWGDGSPTREFLYVKDAARAVVLAAENYDKGEPVNLGSRDEISIKKLAHLIKAMTGYSGKIIWDKSKPNGQPRRCLDVSRARSEFNFKSAVRLKTGLKTTLDWYRSVSGIERK